MESKQSKFAVQRKDKNGIIIASVCVAITVLFFGLMFWVYSLSLPSIYAGRISSANSMAKQTADSIICYITENYDSLSADEYYFYGENGLLYLLIYPNEIRNEEHFVYGDAKAEHHSYWAVRVYDGSVVEAWYSDSKLTPELLRPYTKDEQMEQCYFKFGSPFDHESGPNSSHAIGYHDFRKYES